MCVGCVSEIRPILLTTRVAYALSTTVWNRAVRALPIPPQPVTLVFKVLHADNSHNLSMISFWLIYRREAFIFIVNFWGGGGRYTDAPRTHEASTFPPNYRVRVGDSFLANLGCCGGTILPFCCQQDADTIAITCPRLIHPAAVIATGMPILVDISYVSGTHNRK